MAFQIADAIMIVTVCGIFSLPLYKENPYYRFAEHVFLASMLGNYFVGAYKYLMTNVANPLMRGEIAYLIPLILGPLLYASISKKYSWISRISFSLIVGLATGLSIRGGATVNIIANVRSTFLALFVAGDLLTSLNNIIVVVGVVTGVAYFFMTFKQEGITGIGSKIGRYMIMLALGALFGNTIMTRFAYLGGRLLPILQAIGLAK